MKEEKSHFNQHTTWYFGGLILICLLIVGTNNNNNAYRYFTQWMCLIQLLLACSFVDSTINRQKSLESLSNKCSNSTTNHSTLHLPSQLIRVSIHTSLSKGSFVKLYCCASLIQWCAQQHQITTHFHNA